MIHLDASFLIRATYTDSPESETILEWLRAGEALCMSTIAWAEYLCGSPLADEDLALSARIVTRRVDFTEEMAILSARLFNDSGRHRKMLTDCMIAATAITQQASVATVNLKDFQKFEPFGLILAPTVTPH